MKKSENDVIQDIVKCILEALDILKAYLVKITININRIVLLDKSGINQAVSGLKILEIILRFFVHDLLSIEIYY